ncbi:hypothetical protein BBW65_00710 [Helicobacter enhydrae]|uniref:Major facilitator superfamily (MFS) profile domain-containing protein n=1 Tax=Helicobacter enhydrae TaxID=222136 RepID=A0A1B1U3U8_9HELI|nr:MFS transporter [Helicobacter enhydrae]ANV97426.1 hypothetical protein BBW65_00710 [Helicobacter enhydrae]
MRIHPSYYTIIPLTLSAFCMGVAELCIAGVMDNMAHYFNTSLQQTGLLMTLYALGVIIGAPILTIPISTFNRKTQLLINLAIFALANSIVFFSSSFLITSIARFVAGCMHGVFFVIATLSVTQVAQEGRKSQGLAIVVAGLSFSMVSGVPLGALIGNTFGFQILFLCISFLILSVMGAVWVLMPSNLMGQQTSLKSLKNGLLSPHMWRSYLITASFCGSIFAFYTYAEAFFVQISGFDLDDIAWILLAYGFCGIAGNLIGGKLSDKLGSIYALKITFSMLALGLFLIGIFSKYPWVGVFGFCMASFWGFACVASIKILSLITAKIYTPASIESSISLNEASFNVGIAIATFIGGITLALFGVQSNSFFAGALALCGLALVWSFPKGYQERL